MNSELLVQLALNTTLLPDSLSAGILAGNTPPVEDVVRSLIITTMDAQAVIAGDPQSTWNEKRMARMALAVAFLAAMALHREAGAE